VDGVLVISSDGVVRFVNPAAERLLGRRSADLLGTSFGIPILPGESTEIDIVPGLIIEMRVVEIDWDGEPAHLATLHDVTERKRAAEALRFLAEAGTILASSLDTPTTLTSVAWLAVGHLADWCLIDLLDEDGLVRRVIAHHSDPTMEPACQTLCGEAPLEATCPSGLGRVLLTGNPAVLTDGGKLWDLLALHSGQKTPPESEMQRGDGGAAVRTRADARGDQLHRLGAAAALPPLGPFPGGGTRPPGRRRSRQRHPV
jgi:PAS domain-containing protein